VDRHNIFVNYNSKEQRYNYYYEWIAEVPRCNLFNRNYLINYEKMEIVMKYLLLSSRIKRALRAAILLLTLLFNLSPDGALIADAAAPSNDDFGSSTLISAIPYNNTINTLEATAPASDPLVEVNCDGHLLAKGLATVWYKHTPGKNRPISIDTIGSNYDTYVAVWKGQGPSNLTLVACDDDNNAGYQSQLAFAAKAGTTYYIEVAQYNGTRGPSLASNKPAPSLRAPSGGTLRLHVREGANVEVRFADVVPNELVADYLIAAKSNKKVSYSAKDRGPLKVLSLQSVPVVASQRVAYSPDGGTTWTGYSEMMGLPANQLFTSYIFPWYNNVGLNSQLRFANMGADNTNVTVKIGTIVEPSILLKPGQVKKISYTGVDKGPVRVTSSGGIKIVASMRVSYFDGTNTTSFSELMGLPANRLATKYMFPWYNSVSLDSQLRFANMGTTTTTVTVKIGNNVVNKNYSLKPGQVIKASYPGVDTGPVRISSSGNVKIIASMRVSYFDGTNTTSFSEMMGLPGNALSTKYAFPAYNSVNINSQLRFTNVGTTSTNVKVFIGGVLQKTYKGLLPNTGKRVTYASVDNGPIVVQSSGGVPIIASLRVSYSPDAGVTWTNYSEMMGLPQPQWTTIYIFSWYNNKTLNTQLRFGVP
jgi:hypothetical protein